MLTFAIAIFISSFLLFQIQPLIGKYILPWFGGTTSVWSASLLFFQILLTGGYAYSSWLTGRLPFRRQRNVHLSVLGLSLALLIGNLIYWDSPILPGQALRPQEDYQPLFTVLKVLFVAVGVPYFLLATNSTLMQAWFARKHPERSPYQLYALSNAASLIGLITYPFLVEPLFSLRTQSIIWSGFYLLFAVITGFQAWRVPHSKGINLEPNQETRPVEGEKLAAGQYRSWIGLAALGSIMLLSTTSRITQEVAAIPFLWVLPLSIYIFTFVVAFSGSQWYKRPIYLLVLFISTIAYLWFVVGSTTGYVVQLVIYGGLLFSSTMICHGELYHQRPRSDHLTIFYLMVSVGGAVGGIIVNLIVPHIFRGFWEFQVGLSVIWVLMLVWVLRSPIRINYYVYRLVIVFVAATTCIVIGSFYIQTDTYNQNTIISRRNFYGILNVKEKSSEDPDQHRYVLTHGITTHGFQFSSPEKRYLPTGYYVEDSGVGIGFKYHPARPGPLRVGMIGLGVGVLAAYGEVGDEFRFYEINPAVLDIAMSEYFSYLKDTKANVEIVLGDGRMLLERERTLNGSNNYDYLIVDAFNSDSIPTHLLTKEAFELYLHHLNPEGILALHISNRFLNLRPVVWGLADTFDMESLTFYHTSDDTRSSTSSWILLTNNQAFLANHNVLKLSVPRVYDIDEIRPWTDDYSNLFQILK